MSLGEKIKSALVAIGAATVVGGFVRVCSSLDKGIEQSLIYDKGITSAQLSDSLKYHKARTIEVPLSRGYYLDPYFNKAFPNDTIVIHGAKYDIIIECDENTHPHIWFVDTDVGKAYVEKGGVISGKIYIKPKGKKEGEKLIKVAEGEIPFYNIDWSIEKLEELIKGRYQIPAEVPRQRPIIIYNTDKIDAYMK